MKVDHHRQRQATKPEKPVDERMLPINPNTGKPIQPIAQPGYYPGYHTLSQKAFWDEATRKVVLDRVHNVPPIRFFRSDEVELMQAIVDRLLPQDDRDEAHKIPIVNYIDEKLYVNRIDGYRYVDMVPEREAYRIGLIGIQAIAQHLFGQPFTELEPLDKDRVLETLHDANPPVGEEVWQKMPVNRYWTLLLGDVIEGYYAHPYAWDEIGFGGPSYPRGYMRLEGGRPEPWEVEEQRYAWAAPPTSLSGENKPLGGPGGFKNIPQGQGGTH